MTQYNVDIAVRSTGADKASADLDGVGKSAQKTSGILDGLKGVLAGVAAAFAVDRLIQYADGYATLQARLKGVSKDAAEYALVSDKLVGIANDSRTGLEETANLYAKLKIGTQGLSFSTEDLLKVTGSINKTFAISGASAEETARAITQLNQGLAAGALRGEDFNSVQEATQGEFGRIIESAGLAQGKIRDLADSGKLSADLIIKSFQKVGADIDSRFAQIPLTVGQAFTVLNNAIFNFVGQANQGAGVTQIFAAAIVAVANNLQTILGVVIAVGAGLATYYAAVVVLPAVLTAWAVAQGLVSFALGTTATAAASTSAAMTVLNAILSINPFVALAVAIVTVGTALYALVPNMTLFGSTTVTVGGVINSTFTIILGVFQLLGEAVSAAAGYVTRFFSQTGAGGQIVITVLTALRDLAVNAFNAIVDGVKNLLARIGELITSIPIIGPYFEDLGNLIVSTFKKAVAAIVEFSDYIASLLDKLQSISPAAKKIADALRSFGQTVKNAGNSTDSFGSSLKKTQTAAGGASSAVAAANDNTKLFKTYTDQATTSVSNLGDTSQTAFGAVVQGAQSAVSAVDGLRSSVGGLKAGLSDFGSGGSSVNGLSNASSLGGFTINTLPDYPKWLQNFGANPKGNAQSLAQTFYNYAKALTNVDTGGKLPQSIIDNYRSKISALKANLSPEEISSLGNMWDSLQKFRSGGSFTVGGSNATDSNLVMLRATKGERVDVTTPAQQRAAQEDARRQSRPPQVTINISTPDVNAFRRSQDQILQSFAGRIGKAVSNA